MLNRVTLMGRLTRDPELRQTNNGTAVANFSLAVDRDFKEKDGERSTDFLDCVAWSHTANFVAKYCAKGSMVAVDGRVETRDWVDKNGTKRKSVEIRVNDLYFAERKGGNSSNSESAPAPAPAAPSPVAAAEAEESEDLPF